MQGGLFVELRINPWNSTRRKQNGDTVSMSKNITIIDGNEAAAYVAHKTNEV